MKVLIATDGSDCSVTATRKCFDLFRADDLSIKLVSVIEPPLAMAEPFGASAELYREAEDAARQQAETAISQARSNILERCAGTVREADISSDVFVGSPARRIVEEAQEWGADLIVAGSHGYGFWERMMMGSVSQAIAQHAPCSVLIVRNNKDKQGS